MSSPIIASVPTCIKSLFQLYRTPSFSSLRQGAFITLLTCFLEGAGRLGLPWILRNGTVEWEDKTHRRDHFNDFLSCSQIWTFKNKFTYASVLLILTERNKLNGVLAFSASSVICSPRELKGWQKLSNEFHTAHTSTHKNNSKSSWRQNFLKAIKCVLECS